MKYLKRKYFKVSFTHINLLTKVNLCFFYINVQKFFTFNELSLLHVAFFGAKDYISAKDTLSEVSFYLT